MDFTELKKIIDSKESKVVIIENGKPVMVVIGYEDYRKKFSKEEKEKEVPKELIDEPLKVEDLPF
ncbi:type II toxin-antitoxin system prevent-host-death family antitoxin [Candidatus Parcubacteria bacterium]|nr:type II toxin-antitoxin system prevent-host-death family antitoxin [Candidatus Parcubacteria bacterium]